MSRRNVRIVIGLGLLALSIPAFIHKERLEHRSRYTPLTATEEEAFARKYAVANPTASTARIIEAYAIERAKARQRLQGSISRLRWVSYGSFFIGLIVLLGPSLFPQPVPMHAERGLGVVHGRRPLRQFGPKSG